jgi:hypothetical protein
LAADGGRVALVAVLVLDLLLLFGTNLVLRRALAFLLSRAVLGLLPRSTVVLGTLGCRLTTTEPSEQG